MQLSRPVLACGLLLVLTIPGLAQEQKWGTLKGRFVFGGNQLPNLAPLNVTVDKEHCLSKGPIPDESWVIDETTKGVKNVMVWIAVEENGGANHTKAPPIHPSLANFTKTPVVMDQPCCKFEPRMVGIQVGQTFIGKNSSPKLHNMNIQGGARTVGINLAVEANGGQLKLDTGWKPYHLPTRISCTIHPWMKSYVFAFPHPYFAVTNEKGEFEIKNVPAGKFRIVAWHEYDNGRYLLCDKDGLNGKQGHAVSIVGNKPTDLGEIKINPK